MKVRIEWHNSGGLMDSREVDLSDNIVETGGGHTIAACLMALIDDSSVLPGDSFQIVEVV